MEEFLTPKQVAQMLQLTERTLANQRHEGRGIPFIKVERAVRYRCADIEAYIQQNVVKLGKTKPTKGNEEGTQNDI
ncbi:helix-turn-helix domain-containing protein [Photobacterium rosenbergii]|uniref:helix-turn-helix domain-containing protein n=1 Tax=Photobacterium rosenbergii TaxID=294936 RepID=UPI001C994A78|nr:helix-turn-helix domain-containing protein [Photobacterium rosenbergii]MBY5948778.1 helix-turn-helix domain-containing protein [Photobacterium rosenbergii]